MCFFFRFVSFDPKIPAIFEVVTASVSQVSGKDVKKVMDPSRNSWWKLKPNLDCTCTHLVCGKARCK